MLSVFDNIKMGSMEIGGESWPIYCDFHVLQQIQDAGYTVSDFEMRLLGMQMTGEVDAEGKPLAKFGPPEVAIILEAMQMMLMEGMTVYNLLHPAEMKYPDPETTASMLTVMYRGTPADTARLLHAEFVRCYDDGKKKEDPTETTKAKAVKRTRSRKKQTSTNSNS